jgi:hypothetical protein
MSERIMPCLVELSGLPKGTKCLAPLSGIGRVFPIRQGDQTVWYQRYRCELKHTILYQIFREMTEA